MKKLRIKQVRSQIKKSKRQKRTLEALGFKRLYQSIEVNATPQIEGMVKKVNHLLEIEEIK
ncbi:MAG: 50S ribosomal protein L30 [Bacteroidales bacterium]